MSHPTAPTDLSITALIARLTSAAVEAGEVILLEFGGDIDCDFKADESPVTRADRAAEVVIAKHLRSAYPGIPIVAEEEIAEGHVPPDLGMRFFLVDPLDGTKEFIAGLPDFTVNIALVEDGRPIAGVVFAPAYGELYTGGPDGAFKSRRLRDGSYTPVQRIEARLRPSRPLALASRSHRTLETNLYLEKLPLEAVVPVGSSLKFCRIAEGAADLYPCFGRTMEWDTAAGQAVLEGAGGNVIRIEGGDLGYGKRGRAEEADFANPHFLATGRISLPEL
ncbi:MAG: 3'(2'),5'-bisphosphate nucleotidase CysQ [Rhizobiaceae bacterium]|nr:3'(2'),5'-bisphosphate nucleotidase CysQ [Rhizobiaceae bacterium]